MANFNLYKIFLTVAEEKNLTKAGNKMFVSQPAISNAIKELEDSLGVDLFIRKNKGVELSYFGERLYEKCKTAVEKLNDIDEYFNFLKKEDFGIIRIGVNTSNLNQFFLEALTMLLKEYPNVEVSITRYSEGQLYEKLENGSLDYIAVDGEEFKNTLQIITEFNIEYQIIGNREFYSKFKNNPLTIKGTAEANLILANKSYTSRLNIDEFFKKNNIILRPKLELDGYSYVKDFVQMGHGISIVNTYYFKNAINQNELYILNKNFDFPKRKIIFAKNKRTEQAKILKMFENVISTIVKGN